MLTPCLTMIFIYFSSGDIVNIHYQTEWKENCNWSFLNWYYFVCSNLKFTQALAASGVVGVGALGLMYALNESVKASDLELHPPKYPWSHTGFLGGFLKAFDHARY